MTICHFCNQPLAKSDAHDAQVKRPVHKACYALRLSAPKGPTWGPVTDLAPSIRGIIWGGERR